MSKAILFDFDGVLVNTCMIWYEINKVHNPNLDFTSYQAMSNGNYLEIADSAIAAGTFKPNPDSHKVYKERLTEQKVEEALIEMIRNLAGDHKLFVVSSGSEETIGAYLREQNLIDHFVGVLGHEFHRSKEEKINHILRTHGIEPHKAVMITDTSGDIQEAKRAGVKTIGVLWGLHDGDMLAIVRPEKIVQTPTELESAISELLT